MSRKQAEHQSSISLALRAQAVAALDDLLLGFEIADRLAEGALLDDYRRGHLQEVYAGLVTALLRMVFALFAEDRRLLPMDPAPHAGACSLAQLHARLSDDHRRHGDAMDHRHGAWAQVIALFRLLHDRPRAPGQRAGEGRDELHVPARRGDFFDPDRHPFLEGRRRGSRRQPGARLDVPRVSDAAVLRVLDRLLLLGGEPLDYSRLDVEQIGSVYEGLMGFDVEVAAGDSLRIAPERAVVDLEELLRLAPAERLKRLKTAAGLDLKDSAASEVKAAATVEALEAMLLQRTRARAPPWQRGRIRRGSLYLQPGEERRRTGSHYTPRALTRSIVETTLRPVLERLGPAPAPEQILDLRVCDPAMGSGAFLVEACRQLADPLVAAWRRSGSTPELSAGEDPTLHARRLVAQRCLYGVDKNPLAVDLARLSLWLVASSRRYAFPFVDHALLCGDALVGLSIAQIAALRLDGLDGRDPGPAGALVVEALSRAAALRERIRAADPEDEAQLVVLGRETERALSPVRARGDLVVAAYFSSDTEKARQRALLRLALAPSGEGAAAPPFAPFHWEIELPEVFCRERGGFDCIFGNPPFLGGKRISTAFGGAYRDWLGERSPGIERLRALHAAMDRAVLDAYGWSELHPGCDFQPQLDETVRLTWAEETRDELLARLLELNRATASRESSAEDEPTPAGERPARRRAR